MKLLHLKSEKQIVWIKVLQQLEYNIKFPCLLEYLFWKILLLCANNYEEFSHFNSLKHKFNNDDLVGTRKSCFVEQIKEIRPSITYPL